MYSINNALYVYLYLIHSTAYQYEQYGHLIIVFVGRASRSMVLLANCQLLS